MYENKENSRSPKKRNSSLSKDNSIKHVMQRQLNDTGLPDNLKSGIESLSGYSMDDVKVHYNSGKPAQLNAHAYAQGSDIHVASGQEKHLPHEAWHVVQQKQGRVKPTMQMKDKVNINDDVGLEREADVMGARALQMHTKDGVSTPLMTATTENVTQRVVGILSSEADDFVVVASQAHAIAQSGGPVVEMDTGHDKFQGLNDNDMLGLLYHGEDPNDTHEHDTQASDILGYLQLQGLPAKKIYLYLQSCMAGLDATGKVDSSMVSKVKSGLSQTHPDVLVGGFPGSIITPPSDQDKVIVIDPQKDDEAGTAQFDILKALGLLDQSDVPLSWSAMVTKFGTEEEAKKKVNTFYTEFEKQIKDKGLKKKNYDMTTK